MVAEGDGWRSYNEMCGAWNYTVLFIEFHLLWWIRIYLTALNEVVNEAIKIRRSRWDCMTIQYIINKASVHQESKTLSYFKSLYILCMRSGGTDGKSRHQYQLQLNTIACCSQAALHSLIMSGWHCWSHMAAGVWEFNHRAAIKFSLPYGLNPYSLAYPDHLLPDLREAGGGRRTTDCCSSALPGWHQLSLNLHWPHHT